MRKLRPGFGVSGQPIAWTWPLSLCANFSPQSRQAVACHKTRAGQPSWKCRKGNLLTAAIPTQIFPRHRNPLNIWCLAPSLRLIGNRQVRIPTEKYLLTVLEIVRLCHPGSVGPGEVISLLWALVSSFVNLPWDLLGKTEESISDTVWKGRLSAWLFWRLLL